MVIDQSERTTTFASDRYVLEHSGYRLEAESVEAGFGYLARLFVDGEQRDEQRAKNERARLRYGDITVLIEWNWFGQISKCVLVRECADAQRPAPEVPFAPPPDTRAARLARLEQERPVLYAARHLIRPMFRALIPLLGLGALLAAFLPRIDLTWLPAPLYDKLFGSPPAWLAPYSPIFHMAKWLLPVIFAVFIATNEVEKRQKKTTNIPTDEIHLSPESTEETHGTHR